MKTFFISTFFLFSSISLAEGDLPPAYKNLMNRENKAVIGEERPNTPQFHNGGMMGMAVPATGDKHYNIARFYKMPDYEHFLYSFVADGRDINKLDKAGWAPLHYIVMNGDRKVVRVLLEGIERNNEEGEMEVVKADPNVASNPAGITALHIASYSGYSEIVNNLLYYGADINQKDAHGWTALDRLLLKKDAEAICKLRRQGAKTSDELENEVNGLENTSEWKEDCE